MVSNDKPSSSDNSNSSKTHGDSSGKEPKVSIIVPVYKVEPYLNQCLDSIANQTLQDWECILVDDGSPDSCGAICDEYAQRDSRFKVIHRKNGGLSAARNSGLHAAKGKYIGFIDSDDWVEPTLYQRLVSLMEEHDADLVQVNYSKELSFITIPKGRVKEVRVLDRHQAAREMMFGRTVPSYVWNKLYRREIINMDFPEGKNYEDIFTLNSWMENIKTVVLAPERLCHYRCRRGSIINSKAAKDRINCFEALIQRVYSFDKLEPGFLTEAERQKFLWKNLLGKAKCIARIETMSRQERIEALKQVYDQAVKDFGTPQMETLGKKYYNKILLLGNDPDKFISNALRTQKINSFFSKLLPGL